MQRIIIVISLLLVLVFAATCSSPTEPGNNNGNQQDTTSHNFTWQKYSFGGGGGSSVLHDVAIINDTNIYAVGEMYIKDSLGNDDPIAYNAVHWDGKKWKVEKIMVWYRGKQTIAPLTGIFILQDDKIVLSSGLPYLPNKSGGWELYHLWDMGILNQNDGSVNHIWGTSLNDLFFVGNNGTIVHYKNGSWQRMESGTNVDIQDIWGEVDPKTNQTTVLAVASLLNYGRALNLLQIKDNSVTRLDTTGLHVNQHSIWFQTDKVFYVVGNGVYKKNSLSDTKWAQENGHPFLYKEAIRGNNWNDLFIVGDFGLVSHYNGSSWKHYDMNQPIANFYSVSVKGNTVAAVGQDGDNAVIIIGKRN